MGAALMRALGAMAGAQQTPSDENLFGVTLEGISAMGESEANVETNRARHS